MAKIAFIAGEVFQPDILTSNKAKNSGLGLPFPGAVVAAGRPLAIIGGGPQISRYTEELKAWDGDIWAINGAFGWCLDNGIRATFYSLDASDGLIGVAERARIAILADSCSPLVFDAVDGPVFLVDMDAIPKGCTSACTAPMLAALKGYSSLTFYGCESSFSDAEHAYSWAYITASRVKVECGGREYLTTPQLIMQAEYLADISRSIPNFITVKGDGFLPALIEHSDYSVTKISRDLAEGINAH